MGKQEQVEQFRLKRFNVDNWVIIYSIVLPELLNIQYICGFACG